jgi:carbonic anhydrase
MNAHSFERSLAELVDGNARFAAGTSLHPRQDGVRRAEVLERGQKPFAAIVACSDSRVSPEIVFDQGLGDLFVVRTAGNLLDDLGVASLEYAAAHLDVPLIVVLGHSRCGAVTSAVEGGRPPGRLSAVHDALAPAVERAAALADDRAGLVDAAARENVLSIAAMLEGADGVLKSLVERGAVRVVGAFYDIERGVVEFIR